MKLSWEGNWSLGGEIPGSPPPPPYESLVGFMNPYKHIEQLLLLLITMELYGLWLWCVGIQPLHTISRQTYHSLASMKLYLKTLNRTFIALTITRLLIIGDSNVIFIIITQYMFLKCGRKIVKCLKSFSCMLYVYYSHVIYDTVTCPIMGSKLKRFTNVWVCSNTSILYIIMELNLISLLRSYH